MKDYKKLKTDIESRYLRELAELETCRKEDLAALEIVRKLLNEQRRREKT